MCTFTYKLVICNFSLYDERFTNGFGLVLELIKKFTNVVSRERNSLPYY